MCGINGYNWPDKETILGMNEVIRHRGPDGEGIYSDEKVTLGHLRLAIHDLTDKGHQPMFYTKEKGACSEKHNPQDIESSKISIVYNGEIYNFQELRKKLEKKGYKFVTGTDTEVILASYLEYGFKCVSKFNGMWSFAIYDYEKNVLFCSRDRLGVKPFYYYHKDREFVFSSELKGILQAKPINKKENVLKESVELYFSLGYIPAPYTIYKDCYKLEAAHNLKLDLEKGDIEKWQYWELPDYNPEYNKEKLVLEGRKLLSDATRLRMIADVPVGAFLSGGLDSSAVVGAMSKHTTLKNLHTFSIGFEGKYDETKYVNIVKNHYKTKHHHYYFKEKDFENLITTYSEAYDEPFGDYSGFPTYKVSGMAKKQVTVALSGDGGDEVFGGYNIHLMGARMDLVRKILLPIRIILSKIPAKKNLDKMASLYLLKEAFRLSLHKQEEFYAESLSGDTYKPKVFKEWSKNQLKKSIAKGGNKLSEGLRIYDLLDNTLQNNFLVKVDRASMQNSLEARSPFLDYRFVEYSQKIPAKWKVNAFKTKILMRQIIKGIVPEEILGRGKQGFEPPLDKWITSKKYSKIIKESIETIKKIDNELYLFFKQRALKENNKLNTNYKIKLFLFINWWNKWINEKN